MKISVEFSTAKRAAYQGSFFLELPNRRSLSYFSLAPVENLDKFFSTLQQFA
jgi:hypothetical protein